MPFVLLEQALGPILGPEIGRSRPGARKRWIHGPVQASNRYQYDGPCTASIAHIPQNHIHNFEASMSAQPLIGMLGKDGSPKLGSAIHVRGPPFCCVPKSFALLCSAYPGHPVAQRPHNLELLDVNDLK